MVCTIKNGLPTPGVPFPHGTYNATHAATETWGGSFHDYVSLVSPVISVVLIGYMESMTIAQTCFRKYRGFQVRPSQELIAIGSCNFCSSWFQGFSVTGSFSRTAVNADTGAASPISGALAAVIVGIVLLTLTDVMYFMPKVTLSSIVITAVIKLIDIAEAIKLWMVKKTDFLLFALVFITTLIAGIDAGLIVGIATNWVVVLFHLDPTTPFISTPKCVANVIGRVDGVANRWVDMYTQDETARNAMTNSGGRQAPSDHDRRPAFETTQWQIAFVNHWTLMMFVNSGYLTKVITELSNRYTLRYLVMNWRHVEMADSSCLQTLEQRLGDMCNLVECAQICLVDPNDEVRSIIADFVKAHHLGDREIPEHSLKNWWCLDPLHELSTDVNGSILSGMNDESVNGMRGGGDGAPKAKAPALIVFDSLEAAYRYVSRADQPLLDGSRTTFTSRDSAPQTYVHVPTDEDFLSPGGTPVGLVVSWPRRPIVRTLSRVGGARS
jgi:MFS superfamily sulfate permease-like transporter